MKKQLIYHSHVNTDPSDKIEVCVDAEQTKASCHLERVCRAGLTLSCDASTLRAIMPNKECVAPKNPLTFTTRFTLNHDIEAKCRVIFARRLSRDKFIIELKFIEVKENAKKHLDKYIEMNLKSEHSNKPKDQDQIISQPLKFASSVRQINKDIKLTYSKVA